MGMEITLSNAYYIDGMSLYDTFGITLAKGSLDDFLKLPKRKESISHNFSDEDGLDVDTSRVFFEAKEINVKCYIIADSEDKFWPQYDKFLSILRKPGLRRFTVTVFNRDYFVFYRDCTAYGKITHFRNSDKLICDFNLSLTEQIPGFNNVQTYLITEDNLFIIT